MLQTIREHTQGWIAAIIISIIILTFALFGVHSYFEGGGQTNTVAEVNGVAITKSQLADAYERLRRQMQAQFGNKMPMSENDEIFKERALQALIEVEVLKQSAYDDGFRVSEAQVTSYLQSIPAFQVNGEFSYQRFQEILNSSMLSTGEFINLLQSNLLIDQPKLGIISSAFSLPNETNYAIALINQERDVDYIKIPFSLFKNATNTVSQEKLKSYYNAHKNEFMTPEQVSVEYLQLSLADLTKSIETPDASLKKFYEDNKNTFMTPKQWKIAAIEIPLSPPVKPDEEAQAQKKLLEIKDEVKAHPETFNQFAQTYPASLSSDWVALNDLPTTLKKPLAALNVNDISAPIRTERGLLLIQVSAVKPPEQLTYEAAAEQVKALYTHQQAEEKFSDLREQLANLTYEHPESLQTAQETLKLPLLTSETFSKDQAGAGIFKSKKIRDVAFSHDVLNLRNNSDVIQVNPETIIVLRLKSHSPAALQTFETVSGRIADNLASKDSEKQTYEFAKKLKEQLASGADPDKLAASQKLSWEKLGFITRYANKTDSAISDLAFRLPNPAENNQKVQFGIIQMPESYALVALKAVREGRKDPQEFNLFAEQMQRNEGQLEYEMFKQSQIAAAKIKSNI